MNPPISPRWNSDSVELFVMHESDVTDDYVKWLNDPLVNRFLESRFQVQDKKSVSEFVRANYNSSNSLFCGIRAVDLSRKHIGNIKLSPIDMNHGLAQVGIMIGDESARGKGIGTEAIRIISDIARHDLGLRKLTAGCYSSNVGSLIAFQRAGFEVVAERRAHFLLNGNPEALILMERFL
jgi:ribosomal-protein-alanine N-acetyltransferase